ncbi:teneurin-2, partial [Tachysurus ichikawai]
YDYMERLDGKEKWSVVESPRERRSIQTVVQNEAIFVQYLDSGTWHLAFYNDGKEKEPVSFSTVALGRSLYTLSLPYRSYRLASQ